MSKVLLFFTLCVAGIACFILLLPHTRSLPLLVLGVGLGVIALPMIVIALPKKPSAYQDDHLNGDQSAFDDD